MKLSIFFLSFLSAWSFSAVGNASNASSAKVDRGTINDLPNPILKCIESQDGSIVADGRIELTIAKDQFSQLSVQIVQKDQFLGDAVLGLFLVVEEIFPNQHPQDFDARRPDLIYHANGAGKQMVLLLWNSDTTPNVSFGRVVLTTTDSYRSVTLSCKA